MTQTTAQDLPSSFPTFSLHFNNFIFLSQEEYLGCVDLNEFKRTGWQPQTHHTQI